MLLDAFSSTNCSVLENNESVISVESFQHQADWRNGWSDWGDKEDWDAYEKYSKYEKYEKYSVWSHFA